MQARKHASTQHTQARKHASKEARKQASKQASKRARRVLSKTSHTDRTWKQASFKAGLRPVGWLWGHSASGKEGDGERVFQGAPRPPRTRPRRSPAAVSRTTHRRRRMHAAFANTSDEQSEQSALLMLSQAGLLSIQCKSSLQSLSRSQIGLVLPLLLTITPHSRDMPHIATCSRYSCLPSFKLALSFSRSPCRSLSLSLCFHSFTRVVVKGLWPLTARVCAPAGCGCQKAVGHAHSEA